MKKNFFEKENELFSYTYTIYIEEYTHTQNK